jgi:hypothetical protein
MEAFLVLTATIAVLALLGVASLLERVRELESRVAGKGGE